MTGHSTSVLVPAVASASNLLSPKKSDSSPLFFGLCLLWPNGRPSQQLPKRVLCPKLYNKFTENPQQIRRKATTRKNPTTTEVVKLFYDRSNTCCLHLLKTYLTISRFLLETVCMQGYRHGVDMWWTMGHVRLG